MDKKFWIKFVQGFAQGLFIFMVGGLFFGAIIAIMFALFYLFGDIAPLVFLVVFFCSAVGVLNTRNE